MTGGPSNPGSPGACEAGRALRALREALGSPAGGEASLRTQRERIGLASQVFLLSLRLHWKGRAAGGQGAAASAGAACGLRRHPP